MAIKQDPGAPVSRTDMWRAHDRFVGFHQLPAMNSWKVFANYLGVSKLTKPNLFGGTMMMRASAVRKIQLLNSPYWYVILRAREARKSNQ